MLIKRTSLLTGRINEMEIPVTQEDLEKWKNSGRCIQNVFPTLTNDQREFLLSGSTPEEWNEAIPDE